MKMKRFLKRSMFCIFAISVILPWSMAFASTINVPEDQPTIQAGIDAASNGDTVLVADGTYKGPGNKNLDFKGKAIMVKSENGADNCIIDCENDGRGFYFHTGESHDSVVSGFTITNGVAESGGGIYCGDDSSPTITKCIIYGNSSSYSGGGICCVKSSPLITYCTIRENQSDLIGGGIACHYSSPTITQCTITENKAWHEGGGIYCTISSPEITKCRISDNTAINYYGGGIMFNAGSSATVINCIITRNTSQSTGGGIMTSKSSPNIVNCTISDNTAMYYGGNGIACWGNPSPTITNSILWNNSDDEVWLDASDLVILYSDVKGGYTGVGNIASDPLFVGSGNYSLTANSPCINVGTSNGAPSTDIDGTSRPQGAGYDMGAYELVVGATIRIPSDYSTIQEGIDAASNGDTVLVADGTYTGTGNKNLDFKGKAITVKSENGGSSCIIDCEGSGQGFYFHSGEGADSVLSGFTITNGNAVYGGGIACWYSSSPTIADCIVNANMATNGGGGIACLASSSPTITRCIISGNTGGSWGGGIHCEGSSSPTITNCLIFENEVLGLGNGGGGISCYPSCSPVIMNSTITGNTVSDKGGGVFSHDLSSPTVVNSIIWGNTPNELYGTSIGITYSDVKGGFTGEGNIDFDPFFIGSGDYHLTANSACINAGASNGAPDTDLSGTSRPQGNAYDMGAYEYISGGPANDSTVPDTGQTESYTDIFGEDSDYLINPPSYTKLNGNGDKLPASAAKWFMVKDNVTGLIWEVKTDDGSIHDKDNTYTWQDAQDVFITDLNETNFGGHSDWRVPTIKELSSIVDYGTSSPAIDSNYFPKTTGDYWSSNAYSAFSNPSTAWRTTFIGGTVGSNFKSYDFHVRAVRGSQFGNSTSLTVNGDGTVTDSSTGLMWQQETAGPLNWENSLDYSENLTLGGHSDWRLPNIKELQSIVDYNRINPSIDTEPFPGTASASYWSATATTTDSNRAWAGNFYHGDLNTDGKSEIHYVRAVRGGQNQLADPPTVSTGSAASVTSNSAILNGTVNPSGASTTVVFEYGTTTGYGSSLIATQSPLTGSSDTTVSASITELTPDTSYHFRVKATNSAGTTYGDDQTFTTSAPPVPAPMVTTGSASQVTSTSAMLNGAVNPNGAGTTYYFEYDTTTSYGATTSVEDAGSGASDVSVTASVTGLSTNTTYYYRIRATNSAGTTYGDDQTFATSTQKPTLSIGSDSGTMGQKITLPITLANVSGTDIGAVSLDIGYDTTVFKKPTATIGPAGSAVGKTVSTSDVDSGVFRVSVFSVSNNTAISDGVVAYLTLDIEKDALTGETTLANTPSASDPQGEPVGIEGSDGLVNITEYAAGDCNGDERVTIDEVQSAINMVLDILPVEDCVDVNGNGKVSIGEVQKVINNHLGVSATGTMNDRKASLPGSAIPSLAIGEASGAPGETVTVAVRLKNLSGSLISAILTDIGYDSSVLENPVVEIGPAASAAGKMVISNEVSSGTFRIGVLSISNNDAMGDGIVAYVSFEIKADVSLGQTTLQNSPEASDPSGNEVSINGTNGSITTASIIYIEPDGECGGNTPCFSGVQEGVNSAEGWSVIKAFEGTYEEDLVAGQTRQIILKGGWDSGFISQPSTTTIKGSMVVRDGRMKVSRIKVHFQK